MELTSVRREPCAAQSALANVRQHSKATHVQVTLARSDDEIRLEPGGLEPERRRIPRSAGSLRIAKEGSLRSKTLVLSSLDREHRLPLHFMDRQEIVDACYDHGWDFGD